MTPEDLEQIKAVVSDAMAANNEVLLARLGAMQDHFEARIAQLCSDGNGRLSRIDRRLDQLDRRFTDFELQMARIISQSPRLRSAMAN